MTEFRDNMPKIVTFRCSHEEWVAYVPQGNEILYLHCGTTTNCSDYSGDVNDQ